MSSTHGDVKLCARLSVSVCARVTNTGGGKGGIYVEGEGGSTEVGICGLCTRRPHIRHHPSRDRAEGNSVHTDGASYCIRGTPVR